MTLTRAVSNFYPPVARHHAMANSTFFPILVPIFQLYLGCLPQAETDTFNSRYTNVSRPYCIGISNATTAASPQEVDWQMCAAAQEVFLAAFLQWRLGTRGCASKVALLHYILSYVSYMRIPDSL